MAGYVANIKDCIRPVGYVANGRIGGSEITNKRASE
jgi:hypothetical protein